jgi:hypothetical protein
VFVELERGVEGLIHISELPTSRSTTRPSSSRKRRIALSLKSAAQREETVEAMIYVAEQQGGAPASKGGDKPSTGRAGATLGDLLKDELAGIKPQEK